MNAAGVASLSTVQSLLSLGADATIVTKTGKSCADFAEEVGQQEVADLLEKSGERALDPLLVPLLRSFLHC